MCLGAVHLWVPLHWEAIKVESHLHGDHVGVGAEGGFGCVWGSGCWFELVASTYLSKEVMCCEGECPNDLRDELCRAGVITHEAMFMDLEGVHEVTKLVGQ